MNFIRFIPLAATAAVITSPAFADVVVKHHPTEDVPMVEVRYGDLDLDSPLGRDRLTTRINSAVRSVCGNADIRALDEFAYVRQCRVDSTERAYAERDALFTQIAARNQSTQLALATPQSMSVKAGQNR